MSPFTIKGKTSFRRGKEILSESASHPFQGSPEQCQVRKNVLCFHSLVRFLEIEARPENYLLFVNIYRHLVAKT